MKLDTFKIEVVVSGPDVGGFFHATALTRIPDEPQSPTLESHGTSRSPGFAAEYAVAALAEKFPKDL